MESLGIFNSYDKMCDVLHDCYEDTAVASIQKEEEGAVLYLI